jgi:hypothetical protein
MNSNRKIYFSLFLFGDDNNNNLLLMVLLLSDTLLLLFYALALPRHGKALANIHVGLCLCHERIADILLAAGLPAVVVLVAKGPDGHVARAAHEFASDRWRLRGDVVNIHLEFFAKSFERQIVDIVAKGVLDFATNGRESDTKRGKKVRRKNDRNLKGLMYSWNDEKLT